MATENDIVSIDASGQLDAATNAGRLSVATRSRALAALDRLIGGLFDWPAAKIDARIDAIKHAAELKRRFREAQAKGVVEALESGDSEKAQLLSASAASNIREFEKTLNLAAVASEAVRFLTDQSTSSAEDEGEQIDDDWLNRFRHFAQEATSDDMRGLWARVLAGEISMPGSFSASSLRFIFELDRRLADICERYALRVLDGQVVVIDEDKRGQPLLDALALQSAGLITGVGGTLTRTIKSDESGGFVSIGRAWALKGKLASPKDIKFDAWLVTRVGEEIFSLLDAGEESSKFRRLSEAILAKHRGSITELELLQLGPDLGTGHRAIVATENLLI